MGLRKDVERRRVWRMVLHARWSARTTCVARTPVPSANKARRFGGENGPHLDCAQTVSGCRECPRNTIALQIRKAAEWERVVNGGERERVLLEPFAHTTRLAVLLCSLSTRNRWQHRTRSPAPRTASSPPSSPASPLVLDATITEQRAGQAWREAPAQSGELVVAVRAL